MEGITMFRGRQLVVFMLFVIGFAVGAVVPEVNWAAPIGAAGAIATGVKLWGEPALQKVFRPVQPTGERQSA